ncbi:MAG TPA: ACT domain-containing protein [Acidimicrobiales bacterium]|nr:ACT domain-containing protein [Acidimicrobiales bacterium]
MDDDDGLDALLADLDLRLDEAPYVFATARSVPAGAEPVAVVTEDEGTTLVLERSAADRLGLPYAAVAAHITVGARSDLDLVGLTAVLSGALAAAGLFANVIAGAFHDHLFVPYDRRHEAMAVLGRLGRPGSDA